jgi:hypothetical protein|tara:strand:- start:322 stop:576 length:255 start_codon:yes stop_codon:yes gene_type:complete
MEKSFTTGVFIGAISIVSLMFIVSFKNNNIENINRYEFHDLKGTTGVIFDKATGEIEYKEIRTSVPNTMSYVELSGGINTFEQN